MMIIGTVESKEEAFEIQRIVKYALVGERFRYVGGLSRKTVNDRCKSCGTKLKKVYTDKNDNTLFCPNKKCNGYLKRVKIENSIY